VHQLISSVIYLTGIAVGFAAWYFKWPAMPLYSLILLLPSLFIVDYYTTTKGLEKGQEEANPIFRKFFLTGDLRRDVLIPVLLAVGLAIYLGTNKSAAIASYFLIGSYLALFVNNGLIGTSDATEAR
jgi:hypothetical protein